ncbi:MAG TPA: indole-3-glycerol phosphate synthase TrpC [Candidatus Xenobia bacterium]|nr:indole-3-glycerol phosphate synthase TrpC [Candidatus Xenobia bacterium]
MASSPRTQTADMLERILAARRQALAQAKQMTPAAKLEERAAAASPPRDFAAALRRDGLNIVAELKKASPSRGLLRPRYNPAALAPALEAAGACALSVLTEPEFFRGSLEDLQTVAKLVGVPVLRKDFLFDSYQLFEARAAGADAFLLIAAILSAAELRLLLTLGRQLGMSALVEVHTADELARALDAEAEIIGVNNRDLKTFSVDIETSLRLVEAVPDACLVVSESGLWSNDDLQRLRAAGFDAFLIGEHLMRATEPAAALAQLQTGETK